MLRAVRAAQPGPPPESLAEPVSSREARRGTGSRDVVQPHVTNHKTTAETGGPARGSTTSFQDPCTRLILVSAKLTLRSTPGGWIPSQKYPFSETGCCSELACTSCHSPQRQSPGSHLGREQTRETRPLNMTHKAATPTLLPLREPSGARWTQRTRFTTF